MMKRYCEQCDCLTNHTEHGFEGANYRVSCNECKYVVRYLTL